MCRTGTIQAHQFTAVAAVCTSHSSAVRTGPGADSGRPLVITEKLDGTNLRIHWDGYRVSLGGRTERAQLHGDLIQWVQTNLPEELFEQKFGLQPVTLYGEGVGPGIQAGGGNYGPVKKFVLFDVLIDNVWRTNDTITEVAETFGLDQPSGAVYGGVQLAIDIVSLGLKSSHGDFTAEGLVGVPTDGFLNYRGGRIMLKVKTVDFGPGSGWNV